MKYPRRVAEEERGEGGAGGTRHSPETSVAALYLHGSLEDRVNVRLTM